MQDFGRLPSQIATTDKSHFIDLLSLTQLYAQTSPESRENLLFYPPDRATGEMNGFLNNDI